MNLTFGSQGNEPNFARRNYSDIFMQSYCSILEIAQNIQTSLLMLYSPTAEIFLYVVCPKNVGFTCGPFVSIMPSDFFVDFSLFLISDCIEKDACSDIKILFIHRGGGLLWLLLY